MLNFIAVFLGAFFGTFLAKKLTKKSFLQLYGIFHDHFIKYHFLGFSYLKKVHPHADLKGWMLERKFVGLIPKKTKLKYK